MSIFTEEEQNRLDYIGSEEWEKKHFEDPVEIGSDEWDEEFSKFDDPNWLEKEFEPVIEEGFRAEVEITKNGKTYRFTVEG